MDARTRLSELLESFFGGNPESAAVFDVSGRLISCNQTALEVCGFSSLDEIAGTHYGESLFTLDRERFREAFESALSGLTDHLDTALTSHGGAPVPVEVYVFPARYEGSVEGVFVQMRDSFDLRQTEKSLTGSQQRFRSLFEYHPDAIIALKHDGNISRVNVALEAVTGYYGEKIINKPWTDLIAPEYRNQAEESFRETTRGEAVEFDTFLLDRLGNRIDVQMKLVPLRSENDVEGAYAIAKDVTAQRAAERAIALQGERIRQLYLAASARGESVESQIDHTLELGCRLFGFDFGYVTRFDGAKLTIVNAVGDGTAVASGTVYQMGNSLSRHLLSERLSIFIADLDEEPWKSDPARGTAPWRSYFGTKLIVNNAPFGALVFAGRRPHGGIPDLDRDLLQLIALFVAAALERARYAERIEQLAFYDPLTGLPNRVLWSDRIKQTMAAAKRYHRGFAVMYLDLDNFKEINDRFGHPTGDRVLKAVAECLTTVLRESDTVARFGGDEFVILQPVVNGASDSADLARKIVEALQAPITVEGEQHSVHTSIGIALYPSDGAGAEELMECADRALYRAKHAGRNRWMFHSTGVPLKEWPHPK